MKTSHPPNTHSVYYCPYMSAKDTNNICGEVCHSPIRSKAILCCNANDCIRQRSFVSYSLCSLSFLSQTPAILWQAQRCTKNSISPCQRYSYQARQGAWGMTCQVTAASCLLTPLWIVGFFVLILWSAFLSMVHGAIPTNTSGKAHWKLKGFVKTPGSFFIFYFFLDEMDYFVQPSHMDKLSCFLSLSLFYFLSTNIII